MLNVGKIENGIVLDHIEAGKAMLIYHYLHLDREDYQVAIIKNARSNDMGRKDILKVECDPDTLSLDAVALIEPNTTVNIIKGGVIVEKKKMTMPKEVYGVLKCHIPGAFPLLSRNCPIFSSWPIPSARSTAADIARKSIPQASGRNGSADRKRFPMINNSNASLYGDNPPSSQEDIEKSIRKKFKHDLEGRFEKAVVQYELIEEGDNIAVCISGGKDSMLMAKLFQEIKRHNKFPFTLTFISMDPGYLPQNRALIEENCRLLGIPVTIFDTPIFDSVYHIEKSPCYLCARMRRGYLYSRAKALGCNKIALGHHYDDVIETILMGMLYSGQYQAMMPKLRSTNFEGMELIRPMYLIREDDIKAWRDYNGLRFLQCACAGCSDRQYQLQTP